MEEMGIKKKDPDHNILASIEEYQPGCDGQERQKKLPGDREEERRQEQRRKRGLSQRARLDDRQREDANDH